LLATLGSFYKYINKRMNHCNFIAAVTNKDGNLVVHDSDKADLFNQYFSYVGVTDNGIVPNRDTSLVSLTVLDSVLEYCL